MSSLKRGALKRNTKQRDISLSITCAGSDFHLIFLLTPFLCFDTFAMSVIRSLGI